MKLRRVVVDGFGSLSDFAVDALPDGLTVFYGPNEAGKSTLMRFLRQMLFGHWAGREKRLGDPPIRGGAHGGSLQFEAANGLWTLSRYETKSQVNSTLIAPDDRRLSGEEGEQQLALLRGQADAVVFRSVFSFDLGDLTPLALLDSDELREAIFSAGISGAGASAARALRELDEAVTGLLAVRKGDAPANAALDAMREADARIDEAQRTQARYAEAIARVDDLSATRTQLGTELAEVEARRQQIRQWGPLRELLDRHHAAVSALLAIRLDPTLEAVQTEAAALGAELSAFHERRRRADTLQGSMREVQLRLDALTEEPAPEPRSRLWLGVIVAAVALCGAILLFWRGFREPNLIALLAGAIAAGLGVSAALWSWRRMRRETAAQTQRLHAQTARRELSLRLARDQAEQTDLHVALDLWRQRAQKLLQQTGRPSGTSDEALAAAVESLASETLAAQQNRRRYQEQTHEAETIAAQLQRRAAQVANTEAAGPRPLDAQEVIASAQTGDPAAWDRQERELAGRARELQVRLDTALRDLTLTQSEREALERSTDIAEASLLRNTAAARLQRSMDEWMALRLAARLIETTLQTYQAEHQPEVLAHASEALAHLTAGRWTRVSAVVADELVVEGGRDRVRPEDLSRGAREQLYLALRFGLARHFVARGRALPLIVDDILVNFDPDRQQAAAELMGSLTRDLQLLFFTCHPDVVERLRRVVPDLRVVTL